MLRRKQLADQLQIGLRPLVLACTSEGGEIQLAERRIQRAIHELHQDLAHALGEVADVSLNIRLHDEHALVLDPGLRFGNESAVPGVRPAPAENCIISSERFLQFRW